MKNPSTQIKKCKWYYPSMRLYHLLFVLLSAWGFVRPPESHAGTLTIGTGTSTTSYFPIYTYYTYNYSQSIYLASDLVSAGATSGTPGYINAISYYVNTYGSGFTKSKDWEIYMGNTSSSTFSSGLSWLATSGMTKVFAGSISSSGTGWFTVTLSTPFYWDGTSNLAIAVHENTAGYDGSSTNFRYTSATGIRSIAIYGDDTDPNPATPPTSTAGYSSNPTLKGIPNIQLDYTVATPCGSTVTGGTALASATTLCPGNTAVFTLSGATSAMGLTFQWDTSGTGTSGWAAVSGVLSSPNFTFAPPSGKTLYYRCRVTCTSTSAVGTSTTVAVAVSSATPIPYVEDFESVTPGTNVACAATSGGWGPTGTPYPQWWCTWSGPYSYLSTGSGSADNHTPGGTKYLVSGYYAGPPGTTGGRDYWFSPGFNLETGKTYRFSYWYMSDAYTGYSTTGTGAFIGTAQTKTAMSPIGPFLITAPATYKQYVTDFSVASNGYYYIGIGINSTYYNFGFAIDDIGLLELPLCSTAAAGAITTGGKSSAIPAVICSTPGTTTLGLSSTPPFSGLSFQWEMATGTPGTFAAITGATAATYTQTISTGGAYYFRCKVTCAASGTTVYSDTSAVTTVPITPPYMETFESAQVPNNVPCAANTYSWGSSGYYWSTANAGSPGAGVLNHTVGGSKLLLAGTYLGAASSGATEYWFSPGLALTAGKAYEVSFYFRSANDYVGYDGYNYTVGIAYGNSQASTAMTVLGDTTATPAYSKSAWLRFSRGFVNATTGTKYIGIRVNHSNYMYYGTNIDDIGVVQLPPCAAKPAAGSAFAAPAMICTTGSTTIALKGTTAASDLSFQWQQSTTGAIGSWSNATGGSGATTPAFNTPTLTTGPMYYRCVVTCGLIGAPNTDTSVAVKVNVGPITPPYVEDFEGASVGVNQPCAATYAGYSPSWDPSGPSTYFYQWSISGAPGTYYPAVKNHTTGGSKYLSHGYYLGSYYSSSYNNNYWFSPPLLLTGGYSYKCSYWYVCSGYSSEAVTYGLYYGTSQTPSAMTAITPDVFGENNTTYKKMEGAFIAPSTGVYYLGAKVNHTGYGNYGGAIDDIGVEQLPPCSAKPAAGTIVAKPGLICSSGTSNLTLSGTTMASLLGFQWLVSTTGPTGPFTAVTTGSGGTSPSYTTATLTTTTWYRCVVSCPAAASPNADTTPVYTMNVGAIIPPYKEDFESATIGVNQPCAASAAGYSPSWDASGPTTYYYQWSISGAPGMYYPSVKNRTTGGSKYLSHGYYLGTYYSSSYGNNYWFSPAIKLTKDSTYEVSYWYVCSGYSSEAVTYGLYYGTSQSVSAMSAIRSDVTGKNNTTYEQIMGRFVPSTSGNYYLGLKVNHTGYGNYGGAIDDIGLQQLPACTGMPTAGAITVNPAMLCTPGATSLDMDMAGVTKAGSLSYRWQWTDTDPASGFVPSGSSTSLSSPNFTTGTVSATRWFRCVVKCNNTGDSSFSSIQKVDVGAIVPPYIETFETGTTNMNMPCAAYTYYGGTSVYTARTGSFWGYYYYWNVMGSATTSFSSTPMDNHTPGGSKYLIGGYQIGYTGYGYSQEYWFTPAIRFTAGKLYQLSYWYTTDGIYYGTPANYNIAVFMGSSQTAAAMTTAIGTALSNLNNTDYKQVKTLFTPTTSGNFYVGFRKGQTGFGYGMAIDDIGVQEVPPCSAPVVAGIVTATPGHICNIGGNTSLDLSGSTLATGLAYTWQSRTATTGWTTFATGAGPVTSPSLSEVSWMRCIVTCGATGAMDTTDETRVTVGAVELPYVEDFEKTSAGGVPMCSDATFWGSSINDGFRVWSGTYTGSYGNHTPSGKNWLVGGYYLGSPASLSDQNYWFTPGFNFRAGYKYKLSFWYVAGYGSYSNYVGVYYGGAQASSSMTKTIVPYIVRSNTSYEQIDTTFTMPSSGTYYLGFRKSGSSPSTTYSSYGVAFDDINLNYAPCDGLPFSGAITGTVASGTSLCKGTTVTLIDTGATIPAVPGIKYQWQRRGLAGAPPTAWTSIAGATDTTLKADTLIGYEYRLAVVCGNTGDTAFTAAHKLPALPAHPAVAISPATSPITFCLGDTVHLTATSFSGGVYDWMRDSVTVPGWKFSDMGATEPGTYMVKVTSPLAPCPAYSTPVKLQAVDPGYKVEITVPSDSILCAGTSVTLTAVGSKAGLTYQWRKDGVDVPGATGTTFIVTTSGQYRVMASDGTSTCPAASRNIVFTVKPNPPAVISVPGGTLTACEEVGVLLQANTGSYSYQWNRAGAPVFGWVDSAVVVTASGTYSVKVRSADGCLSESVPVDVHILPSPTPVIVVSGPSSSPTLGTTVTTYLSYMWVRTGATTDTTSGASITATKKGSYRVIVTDANGCTGVSMPVELMDASLGMGNVVVKGADIKIFPNPTDSKVFIESPVSIRLQVKDATGKTILDKTDVTEVDMSKYADGIYMFLVSDRSGKQLIKEQRVNKISAK